VVRHVPVDHLRLVLAELHAMTMRGTASFHNAWDQFFAGHLKNPAGARYRVS
jgi:hypothetical protein